MSRRGSAAASAVFEGKMAQITPPLAPHLKQKNMKALE